MNWNKEIISQRTTYVGLLVLWLTGFLMVAYLAFLEFSDQRFGRAVFLSLVGLGTLFLCRGLLIRVVDLTKSSRWRPVGRITSKEENRANKTPLPTPVERPPSNHDQVPGAADL